MNVAGLIYTRAIRVDNASQTLDMQLRMRTAYSRTRQQTTDDSNVKHYKIHLTKQLTFTWLSVINTHTHMQSHTDIYIYICFEVGMTYIRPTDRESVLEKTALTDMVYSTQTRIRLNRGHYIKGCHPLSKHACIEIVITVKVHRRT